MPRPSPERVINLADLVSAAAERGPAHVALADGASGDTLSWVELDAVVSAQATRLVEAGLRVGDRVAVRMATGIPYCVAVFGVLRAGGVAVPLHTDQPPLAVEKILADCSASLLIGEPVAGTEITTLAPSAAGGPPFAPVAGGEDTAVLCYTSGTSGSSRGVLLSHRALLANADQCAALRPAPVTAADQVLIALPLSHAYGLGPGLIQVARAGATAVLLAKFTPESALRAIERFRVTTLVGVPPMYAALLSLPAERLRTGLATVRLFTSGAAPLPPALLDEVRAVTGLPVFEGYGLTETGPVLTSTLVGGTAKPGSVGRPLPGVELRLVDSDGDLLPGVVDGDLIDDERGGTGLVSVRGANLFSGYWPDGAHGPDEQGWFRTGDIGYLDPDGDLHLVDRAGDLIIVNGFNVYPHEVEQVLAELPGVVEAAAVGVPDERTGEAVRAVIVAAPDAQLTEAAVRAHCEVRLARFKVPASVEFVAALPHSATGKVARSTLR
ncbi:MAG TPA: AMP-binding protein [Pseudonocardiaceae bacterium]|jgi:long-chain acyl-CoA synthetase|nr:AMP-binding protein [Pseudonocardiaceae bacterium]